MATVITNVDALDPHRVLEIHTTLKNLAKVHAEFCPLHDFDPLTCGCMIAVVYRIAVASFRDEAARKAGKP